MSPYKTGLHARATTTMAVITHMPCTTSPAERCYPQERVSYMRTVNVKTEEKPEVTELAQILHPWYVAFFKYSCGSEVKDTPMVSQPVSDITGQI